MTQEDETMMLRLARQELVAINIRISEAEALKPKQAALRDLLLAYDQPFVWNPDPDEGKQSQPDEEPPVDEGVVDESTVDTTPVVAEDQRLTEAQADESPRHPGPRPQALQSNVAAARPSDIPTNFRMTSEILLDQNAGLTASQIVDRIRDRWWPGVLFDQVAPDFYRFIKDDRMRRDDDGRISLTEKGRQLYQASVDRSERAEANPRTVPISRTTAKRLQKMREQQRVKPTAEEIEAKREQASGHPSKAKTHNAFELDGQTIMLPVQQANLANYLHEHIGKGCIGHDKLAHVAGPPFHGMAHKPFVEDLVASLNASLSDTKVTVEAYQKLGFFMRVWS